VKDAVKAGFEDALRNRERIIGGDRANDRLCAGLEAGRELVGEPGTDAFSTDDQGNCELGVVSLGSRCRRTQS
jgi:hypothetical protein